MTIKLNNILKKPEEAKYVITNVYELRRRLVQELAQLHGLEKKVKQKTDLDLLERADDYLTRAILKLREFEKRINKAE